MEKILYNNQNGMSLIQVLLASAMMGGLAVLGMRIMVDQQRMSVKMHSDFNTGQFNTTITGYLAKKDSCSHALGGLEKGEDVSFLKFDDKRTFIKVGDPLGSTGLTLKTMKILTDAQALDANLQVDQNLVHLQMQVTQSKATIGKKDKILHFSFVADVGKEIIIEGLTEDELKSTCKAGPDGKIVGKIETIYDSNDNPIYTGSCTSSEGTMILSCGIP